MTDVELDPADSLTFEMLKVEREQWVTAYLEGYITEGGTPNTGNLRTNSNGTLLGCQGGYKLGDLEDTCHYFLSGGYNQLLGGLGLPRLDPDEMIGQMKRAAKSRKRRPRRQRARDEKKEDRAWLSRGAARVLGASSEVTPSTWAVYAALCILAAEEGAEEFESNVQKIADVVGIHRRTVAAAIGLLSRLRLVQASLKPFSLTTYKLLSVA